MLLSLPKISNPKYLVVSDCQEEVIFKPAWNELGSLNKITPKIADVLNFSLF
jgi:hypothetical protein